MSPVDTGVPRLDEEPRMSDSPEAELLAFWHAREPERRIALLTEDNPVLRMFGVEQLRIMFPGLDVRTAHDGRQALEMMSDPDFAARMALKVTDARMPQVDGFGVIEWMRGTKGDRHVLSDDVRRSLGRVPVVLFTGSDELFTTQDPDGARVHQMMESGALQGVVHKLDGPLALRREVGQALKRMMGMPLPLCRPANLEAQKA